MSGCRACVLRLPQTRWIPRRCRVMLSSYCIVSRWARAESVLGLANVAGVVMDLSKETPAVAEVVENTADDS